MGSSYNKKLSIIHINAHDVAGGAAKVAWRLAEAQRRRGHDSKMLVGRKMCDSPFSTAFAIESDPAIMKYCVDNGQLFYHSQGSHKLPGHPLVNSADVLHLHNLHANYFNPFSLSALSHAKPLVWTLHDMQSITGHCVHSFDCDKWQTGCGNCPYLNIEPALKIDTSAQLLADKKLIYDHSFFNIVTPSDWLRKKVQKSILKDHPIDLIYNGVDTAIFKPYDRTQARRKYGIGNNVTVIGAVAHGGALTNQWKGGQYTEAALKALPGLVDNFVFVNIGGDYETDDPRIINIPHINDESELAQAYSTLDIFLNTSIADNCPLVILEALSCGVPVVSFDTGGIGELVLDNKQGCITPYCDQNSLITALVDLISNSDRQRLYSRNARQRAIAAFDYDVIASQYEKLYIQILEESISQQKQTKLLPHAKLPQVIITEEFLQAENTKNNLSITETEQMIQTNAHPQPQYDVSIVLATKDRAALLDQMLASLKNAVKNINCELIVIEGGSSDNTLDVLRKHDINNIYSEAEHLGPGRHSWPQLYNFGFAKATGKWAMFASDDILFGENCITNAVVQLNKNGDEVAGGIFFYKNIVAENGWDNFGIDFTYGQKLLLNYGLIRLDHFRQVGGLDESYKFYCADGDLCYKFYESGKQLIPLPGSLVAHNNVMDIQKEANAGNSQADITLYKKRWEHFISMETPEPRRLMWQEDLMDALNLPVALQELNSSIEHFWHGLSLMQQNMFEKAVSNMFQAVQSGCKHQVVLKYIEKAAIQSGDKTLIENTAKVIQPTAGILGKLKNNGLWQEGKPLQLHLGCGQRHFDGYINIDYPPTEHTVQNTSAADIHANILELNFPDGTVDEVRLHHVFEHFDRPTALALLCRWHRWLKVGGTLIIETPDLEASMDLMRSDQFSYKDKQIVLRHLFGSHEAKWAMHFDGWYEDKFRDILGRLGFDITKVEFTEWKMTRSIIVSAHKTKTAPFAEIINAAKNIFRDSMVDQVQSEQLLWTCWCEQFDQALKKVDIQTVDVKDPCQDQSEFTEKSLQKKPPVLSIFMPVYNTAQYLPATLDSILNQTFRDFELVIADDGSQDDTLSILDKYAKVDKRIKILRLQHVGAVDARNEAIKHCNPNSLYLLNHDSDDISLPTKFERLIDHLQIHSDIAIVGCFADYFDDDGNFKGQPSIEWQPERIRQTFGKVNSMINSASVMRREVIEKIGVYRNDYSSVDDYDFFARALIAGFELANIPEVLHLIRLHDKSICSTQSGTQKILGDRIRAYYNTFMRTQYSAIKTQTIKTIPSSQTSLSILNTVERYYPYLGGAEIVVQQISERLAKRGHQVTVATSAHPQRFSTELNGVNIEQFDIHGSMANGCGGTDIERYRRFLLEHPADVMMNYAAQQWATDLAFDLMPTLKEQRVNVLAPCGYSALADSKTLKNPQFTDYFNQTIPHSIPLYDAAIYHSGCYQDYEYAQNHGFTNSVIIPNAVCEEEFYTAPKINFCKKYGITTKYMGLCVANFYRGKGHDRIIECVRQMNRPDFTMVFIGKESDTLNDLRSMAADLNIKICVDIPRQDTVAAYHQADIFLFASKVEASPLVIIEAKASRTPFISTDCGNVREWTGGIVCAPEKIAQYANRLLDDETIRKTLAEEGFKEWKEKLTWKAVVDRYEDLYLKLYHKKNVNNKSMSNNILVGGNAC